MNACIFCQIIAGKAPAAILYRDEWVTVFRDAHPAAPVHILIVPNRHIPSVNELAPEDEALSGHLFSVAQMMARQEGVDQDGYRLMINCGRGGGQTVFHLHMHLLAGRRFHLPF